MGSIYQLDDIAARDLYVFKGAKFLDLMYSLLGLDERENFKLLGSYNY